MNNYGSWGLGGSFHDGADRDPGTHGRVHESVRPWQEVVRLETCASCEQDLLVTSTQHVRDWAICRRALRRVRTRRPRCYRHVHGLLRCATTTCAHLRHGVPWCWCGFSCVPNSKTHFHQTLRVVECGAQRSGCFLPRVLCRRCLSKQRL